MSWKLGITRQKGVAPIELIVIEGPLFGILMLECERMALQRADSSWEAEVLMTSKDGGCMSPWLIASPSMQEWPRHWGFGLLTLFPCCLSKHRELQVGLGDIF